LTTPLSSILTTPLPGILAQDLAHLGW
jgi:hypothetical protein